MCGMPLDSATPSHGHTPHRAFSLKTRTRSAWTRHASSTTDSHSRYNMAGLLTKDTNWYKHRIMNNISPPNPDAEF
uniref:Uncharacterized protein n=1 Tax=Arundo donax TaxID=35708 RepID=A0A0A9FCC4_ARUDO